MSLLCKKFNNKDSSLSYLGSSGNGTTNAVDIVNCCKAQGAKVSTNSVAVTTYFPNHVFFNSFRKSEGFLHL